MKDAVDQFFNVLRRQVSEDDIRMFSPQDPGYCGYVACWTKILNSGRIPRLPEFNVRETIALTAWDVPSSLDAPERFLVYRLFTSAVALQYYFAGYCSEDVRPVNYLAIRLIDDSRDRHDESITRLVGNVLVETAKYLKSRAILEEEYPFLYAAEMIWAQRNGDFKRADEAAKRLIAEEGAVRKHKDFYEANPELLFGLTVYNQVALEWRQAASELKNPNNQEETALVIETLKTANP